MGSSGSGSSGSTGNGECVNITLEPSDTSCNTDDDCSEAPTGSVCDGQCDCGGSAVNNAAANRIQGQISSITFDDCPCVEGPVPICQGGQCTLCGFGAGGPDCNDGGGIADGGVDAPTSTFTNDAGDTCIDIDLATYDQSCQQASDCILIFTGEVCSPSDCPCNQALVNISGEPRYDQAYNSLPLFICSCPSLGEPECIAGKCTAVP